MLKPKVLPQVLQQVNTNGVRGSMLFKVDGSLLASHSIDDPTTATHTASIISAIVSNIWSSFNEDGDLEYQLFDCDDGKVVVTKVSKLLLCIYAGNTVEFGILKAKVKTLRAYLEGPLSQVLV